MEELNPNSRTGHAGNLFFLSAAVFAINNFAWALGVGQLELTEHLPSLSNQQHCGFALPGTVLAGVKSLFSYPLPFPSLHPGLLPAEIEPMQTEPWSRPAACSDCLPRGAAGPHYVAAVSITKKEKFQLSMELRTRKQMLDPTDHSDERQAYPKKLSLNHKTFSVATKVMLKC